MENIEQVWQMLELGYKVHWQHEGYKVYVEPANGEYQRNHFSYRKGLGVLTVRCIDNYFGSLIDESDLNKLFLKV